MIERSGRHNSSGGSQQFGYRFPHKQISNKIIRKPTDS
jgi:hypothetical protein